MLFYIHLLVLLLQPSVLWLSIVTFNKMQRNRQNVFDVSRIRSRLGGLPHLEKFTWKHFTPAKRVTRSGRLGGPPHLSCKPDQIKMIDYMDRWVTPPKRVNSPAWGPSPPCKQALWLVLVIVIITSRN